MCADERRPRKLLIVVNPRSGRRKAPHILQQTSRFYRMAGVKLDVVVTQRRGEATELARERDLSDINGIVVYGGLLIDAWSCLTALQAMAR